MFDILKRGKSYYCLRCLREGRLQRVSKFAAGISSGVFSCRYHKGLESIDVAVGEYTNLYCPQCALEGKLQKVLVIYTPQGNYYFCKKHRIVPNPISKEAAKRYIAEAKEYAAGRWISTPAQTAAKPSIKDRINRGMEGIRSAAMSASVKKIPWAFGWFVLYTGIGVMAVARFSPGGVNMIPIFVGAGIVAFILEMLRPEA